MKSPNKIFIKRRTFWVIILPVSLVTAMLLAVFLLKGGGSSRLDDYKRALKESGETLEIAKLAPVAPTEGNSAGEFLAACKELRALADERKIPLLTPGMNPDAKGFAPQLANLPLPKLRKDVPQFSWDEVQSQYASLDPLLQKVREASKSPLIETQPNYLMGFQTPIEGLTDGFGTCQLLAGDGLLKLRQKKLGETIDDIEAILAISRVFQKQPIVISQLVAQAGVGLAQKLTWALLQEHLASEQDLLRLQNAWTNVDLLSPLEATLRLERACGVIAFQYPPRKLAETVENTLKNDPATEDKQNLPRQTFVWRLFHKNDDEFVFLSSYQRLIDSAQKARTSGIWKPFYDDTEAITDVSPKLLLSNSAFAAVSNYLSPILQTQALAELTVAAIALERFATNEIGHPSTLEELVPEYLASVPIDPFDGKPVRYKPSSSGGFSLYSAGFDGTDDQGDPSPITMKQQKDIVWPSPAPVEVQAH